MEFERKITRRRQLILTSLADMIFLLVIFFMLTTNFSKTEQLQLNVAREIKESDSNAAENIMRVKVMKNAVMLGQEEIPLSNLPQALAHMDLARKIILHNETDVNVQEMIAVVDALKSAGGTDITLVRKKDAP